MVKKRVSLVRGRAYRCGEGREITVLGCVYCQSSDLYQHQGILTPQWKRQWRHMFGGRDRSDGGGASKAHLVHSECVTTVGLNGDSRRWISSGDRMTGDRLGGSVSDRLGLYSSFCDLERLEAFTLRMLLVRTEPVSADTAGYRDHTQEQVEQSDLLVESIWEFDIIDAGHSLRHRMMLERGDMTGLILVSESECREMRGGVGGQRLYLRSVVSMGINMYAAYYRWRVCEILSGQGDRTTKVVLVDYMVGAGGEATQDRGSWHIEWGEDEQSFVRDAEMCKRESTRVVLVLEDGWEGEIVTGIVCSVIMEREPRVETGGVLSMKVRLTLWQCKKQTIVATSTTEAEYVAAASCCGQVLWIQNQMLDYGFNFMNTKIHIDNESTICIVKNPVYHSKTKHIEIRHHFIRDSYEKKLIRVEKIHTDFNVADLLTKAFDGPRFNFLVVNIVYYLILVALTHNPTIHDSLVKQFWQTATASTLADGTLELRATIDTLEYTITEASVRSKLQLADASGISMLPNTEIFEGMGNMGYPADGTFTFWKSHFTPQWRFLVHHILHCMSPKSGGWDQFGSNLATALICLSTGRIYNFSKLIFDGMVANLKSKTKFLMYPRFLQMILEIQTENKHPYLAIVLTKKIFGNMKRGFRGVPRPLLPAMLPVVAVDQSAGQADQAVDQPSPSEPLPSSSHPPVISATTESEPTPVAEPTPHPKSPSPEPDSEPIEHTFEQPSPEHQPLSPIQETEVPQSQDPTHPHVAEERTMTVDDLLQLVPKLITKVDSLETELKQTKLTMGKALVKLVKKVKKMEDVLKRRHVVLPDSEDEDAEISSKQGRNLQEEGLDEMVRNMMKDNSEVFKTPTQSKTSGEEDIIPITLEAAKTLSKVASQRSKSVDKSKRYKRIKESKGKDIDTGFEDISTGFKDISTGFEEVNICGLGVSTGSGPVSSARGQREGKAPMIVEETQSPKRTKEQIQQEEASLAEAIRLQTLKEEETAKQVHLDALLTKRMEEEELTEQQKQTKAQVQFEAQHYTEEDWDTIRAKLEANAELTKSVLGKEFLEEDFAKKMVELVNQRKKFFAEERAKAKRRDMEAYTVKKLSFEEVKEEFDKLVKHKQRIDDKDVSDTEEKVGKVKEEEPVKRVGKRKKQKARKGISIDKSPQGDSETDKEKSVKAMNPTPLDTKSNIVANWKIFQQGERSIYQIIRANGADTVYMSFGAMLKDFTREDLIELYRLVMQKYGTNRPEDAYDRVLWSDLRTMFDPPLNEDAIWSLPLQQKMISWRYYDKCAVHCLTLEACNIYMLADRKYPLSKDVCQVMLKMKLLDGKMNEVCYKLLKMIEKQAGVKK
ncbi:hypothetical protein Tco_0751080 [Tanacetum coccineum]|uniref:Uncharacterized protein n=1 Tax=Tanacetum coccineum TaxID=301880 RepID=A0ABQ4Z327_9ASTR